MRSIKGVSLALMWGCLIWATFCTSAFAGDILDNSVKPCVNAYYGIGEPINFGKAYKCFSDNQVHEFLIIMQLNGEGTPKNAKQAERTMDTWLKTDPDNARN
jgi:hypothetical protein